MDSTLLATGKELTTLMVSIDVSGKDISCLVSARIDGSEIKILNTLYGKSAEDVYELLTNTKLDSR